MKLSELLQAARLEPGAAALEAGPDWMQGRSLYGGLQAALGVLAMRTLVPADLPLRSLQVTFLAPVPAGAARAQARVLRAGGNTQHVEARLADGEQTLALLVGVFGRARRSSIRVRPAQPPVADDAAIAAPHVEGVTPAFMQHFGARWLRGSPPFHGDPSRTMVVALDLLDAGAASESHLLAIADFVPPVALSMLDAPTAASSMTWMLELARDAWEQLPLTGWRADSEVVSAADGYTSQSTLIWSPDGDLAALSRQSMVVFG